jgi:SP family xylose:H+ symportor-like MFS transporter
LLCAFRPAGVKTQPPGETRADIRQACRLHSDALGIQAGLLQCSMKMVAMTPANPIEVVRVSPPHKDRISGSLYLVLISGVAAIGGLLFGYDTAVISGAIGLLEHYFALSPAAVGWAASSALAGCVVGTAVAGFGGDLLGRHKILLISAVCFLLSAIGTAFAPSFAVFVAFRIVGGIGIGAASIASPLYIAEIAPARWRGRLVTLNQLAIVSGMLIIYWVNYGIRLHGTEQWNQTTGWRWMFASGILPSLLLLGLLFFVPETTRFLLMRGRRAEAERVSARLGESALEEIIEIQSSLPTAATRLGRVLWIGIVLAVLQQVTGINVFLYYAPEIFSHATHSSDAALLETVIVGAVNLLFTIIAMGLVDRLGRKWLLIAGSLGMAACLIAMGTASIHSDIGGWMLPLVLIYIACFALSVGPVTWIVLSEIFPAHFRARAMAIAIAALWLANFVVSQTFPMLNESRTLIRHFGHSFPFFLYSGFCILQAWFVWRNLPETKNRTLEQISAWWSINPDNKVRTQVR